MLTANLLPGLFVIGVFSEQMFSFFFCLFALKSVSFASSILCGLFCYHVDITGPLHYMKYKYHKELLLRSKEKSWGMLCKFGVQQNSTVQYPFNVEWF